MDVLRANVRLPILFLIIATLLLAAAVGVYTSQAADLGRAIQTELTDHKGNTEQAPDTHACKVRGKYGSVFSPPNSHQRCDEHGNDGS